MILKNFPGQIFSKIFLRVMNDNKIFLVAGFPDVMFQKNYVSLPSRFLFNHFLLFFMVNRLHFYLFDFKTPFIFVVIQ